MRSIYSLAWSPNGRWLAACGDASKVQIWELNQGQIVQALPTKKACARSLSWSPDNKFLACGQGDWREYDTGHIQVWDVATAEQVWMTQEPTYGVYSICFAPNGQWLASGHGSGITQIWVARTGQKYITATVRDDIRNLINGICFSADSQYIACGTCYEDGLYIYSIDGSVLQEVIFPKHASWVDFEHVIRFSPDNEWLARGSQDGQVSLWKRCDPLLSMDFTGHEAPTYAIAWSPNGRFLAGGSRYGEIKVWEVKSEKEVCSMRHRPLHSICYSPDSHFLASGGDDTAIRIWEVEPKSPNFGRCVQILG